MQAEGLALSRIRNPVQQPLNLGGLFAAFLRRLYRLDHVFAMIGDAGLRLEGLIALRVFALRPDRVGDAEFDAGAKGLAERLAILRARLEDGDDQLVLRPQDNVFALVAVVLATSRRMMRSNSSDTWLIRAERSR